MQVQVGTNPKLCLCLELGSSVPKDGRILRRWLAERLRAIVLPAGVWRFNKGGWPILTAALKSFIIDSFHTPHVTYLITAGMDDFPTIAQVGPNYLEQLFPASNCLFKIPKLFTVCAIILSKFFKIIQ